VSRIRVPSEVSREHLVRAERLLPIDWARGLVMVLMAVDHASAILNRGRVVPGSRNLTGGATSFPVDQFFLRWATHICPVTFVFLAGASVVLSTRRKIERGAPAGEIDRFLVTRGLFIVALDFFWMNAWHAWSRFHLDVLTAIGAGIAAMAALRRLPRAAALAVAAGLIVTPELTGLPVPDSLAGLANALYAGGPASSRVFLNYPVLPWVGVMVLGWAWGDFVLGGSASVERIGYWARRTLVPLFAVYLVLRGLNGFGNAAAPRLDGSLQQWLNVSKNPPSLAFLGLELGILGVWLVLFSRAAERGARLKPLAVFGRTALFFYVIHFYVLGLTAHAAGVTSSLGIGGALLGAGLLVLVMYPLCLWYEGYKRRHDNVLTRYV
jgi:uncharacterized membrane protein